MYRDVVGQAGAAVTGERWSRPPQVIACAPLVDVDAVVFAAPVCFESFFVITASPFGHSYFPKFRRAKAIPPVSFR